MFRVSAFIRALCPLIVMALISPMAMAAPAINTSNGYNLPVGVTELSQDIYNIHMIVFYVCVVIALGVFGAMFYSIYRHRKSKGVVAAQFHESTKVEVVWTVIPLLVLVALAIPATKVLVARADNSNVDMKVKVTGYQWKWQYEYLDGDAEGIGFMSALDRASYDALQTSIEKGHTPDYEYYLANVDNRLIIPTGKKVQLLLTSNDVIHSWWVPDFGIKQDAVPGFVNSASLTVPVGKEGIYRGACTELCGKDHAYMPVVVEAVSEAEFLAWTTEARQDKEAAAAEADREWTQEELLAEGQTVYATYCAACHMPNGRGVGAFPSIVGSPIATGPINAQIQLLLYGRNLMPAFNSQLDDAQIAAVITYTRSALNDVGDGVQPREIKAAR